MMFARFTRYVDDPSSMETELQGRKNQPVEVKPVEPSTYDYEDIGPMYEVQFEDGFKHTAFEEELSHWEERRSWDSKPHWSKSDTDAEGYHVQIGRAHV